MIEVFVAAILGFLGITIIDRIWFLIDYKKAEKGLEVLEHFHYGIILMGISVISIPYIPLAATYALLGAATAFIYHESKQKNFFSYKSTHFKGSAVIGIVLTVIFSTLYLLVNYS